MAPGSRYQRHLDELLMNRARKRIESSFSSLVRSLTLRAAQVKTFASLKTRVNLEIAAFNLLHSGVIFR